jgi:hypothetical protein
MRLGDHPESLAAQIPAKECCLRPGWTLGLVTDKAPS